MTRRRRARRAVVLGLLLFGLLQAGLAAAVLLRGPAVRDPGHGRKLACLRKRLAAVSGTGRPLTIVQVGSSRTAAGLRGDQVEARLAGRLGRPVVFFNMGFLGDGPIRTLVKVKQLFNDGVHPDLLLVEVLPPLLSRASLPAQTAPQALPACHLRHDEMRLLARFVADERPDLEQEWWLAEASASSTYRVNLLSRFAPGLLPFAARWEPFWDIDEAGWLPPKLDKALVPQALEAARKTFHPYLEDFQLSPRLLDAVRATVQLAQRQGVAVALVVMPEGPTFRGWYPPGAWSRIAGALTEVSRSTGVPLLDLRTAMPESDFSDSHHLWAEGASLCTRRLAERIEPLLRRPGSRAGGLLAWERSRHEQP
jgi:hypothetical protein